jgi:hypothetical protein
LNLISTQRRKRIALGPRAQVNEVRGTAAIGRAKSRDDQTGAGPMQRNTGPGALAARCSFGRPHGDDTGVPEQIVNVPMQALVRAQMALHAPRQPARPQRTAGIEIETGREAMPSSPANVERMRAVKRDDESVCARDWL